MPGGFKEPHLRFQFNDPAPALVGFPTRGQSHFADVVLVLRLQFPELFGQSQNRPLQIVDNELDYALQSEAPTDPDR